jgi:hypothetical protein
MVLVQLVHDGVWKTLDEQPLPRKYDPEEWVRVEVELIKNRLRVRADGKVIATQTDGTLSEPGVFGVYGEAAAFFRDVEYLGLDK